jgi:FkbM family methyltransferase
MPTDTRYEDAEKYLFDGNWYENSELAHLPALLGGVRRMVDIGASLGPYTLCANRVLSNADIYAIEANPRTFERLEVFCRAAAAQSGNRLHPVHTAMGSEKGQIDFFIPTLESSCLPLTSSTFKNPAITNDWEKVTVDCMPLDGLCAEQPPDFVKMDVEGAEYRVLLGSQRILRESQCRFLIEVHPWGDPTLQKRPEHVFQFLNKFGYSFRRVARHWLFEKRGEPSVIRAVKVQAITVVMRCLPLKEALKKVVLWTDRRKQQKPPAEKA